MLIQLWCEQDSILVGCLPPASVVPLDVVSTMYLAYAPPPWKGHGIRHIHPPEGA